MGFLFLILYPGSLPSRRLLLPPPLVLPHTIFVTYNFAHHLSHTALSHTFDTQLCHTPSFTYNNFTHTQLCHTSSVTNHVAHTIFHTQLCHTPSTHNFVTHHFVTHQISHTTLSHTNFQHNFVTHHFVTHQLSHTTLSHTNIHTQLCHTPSFNTTLSHTRRGTISHPPSFCMAGVALMALGGALGPAWSRVTPRHFAWQACPWGTSTLVSRGRRGAISHPRLFCVAGVALMALGGALGPAWSRVTPWHFAVVLRGRRGTHGTGWRAWARLVARDAAALCVAGVALDLGFTWQAWHSWHWVYR